MKKFVQSEDDEHAIKANIQPIVGVDQAVLAEAKADEKATKKAAKKAAKAAKAAKETKQESIDLPETNAEEKPEV
jgi:hypothetical protein